VSALEIYVDECGVDYRGWGNFHRSFRLKHPHVRSRLARHDIALSIFLTLANFHPLSLLLIPSHEAFLTASLYLLSAHRSLHLIIFYFRVQYGNPLQPVDNGTFLSCKR
jgi:hypothetical protein